MFCMCECMRKREKRIRIHHIPICPLFNTGMLLFPIQKLWEAVEVYACVRACVCVNERFVLDESMKK